MEEAERWYSLKVIYRYNVTENNLYDNDSTYESYGTDHFELATYSPLN